LLDSLLKESEYKCMMSDLEFDDDMRDFMDANLDLDDGHFAGPHFPENLFNNILGGEGVIFQFDNPYDSDDDEYEFYDDDDLLNDDFELENTRKIFVTLQDSTVIKRLSFHKKDWKPRQNIGSTHYIPQSECYEDLYRLLEELELLVRTWRKRCQHPYTAHLRSEIKNSVRVSGEKLVEGEDYNQSDLEDDEPYSYNSTVFTPNESLTKKKFCQSVKIYQRIFENDKQFDIFLRTLLRIKKYVFRVVFQVFMETLPPDTAARLPQELWEKIWKHTQNGYFNNESSVPLLEDTQYYRAGQRSSKSSYGLWRAEQDRIVELFGAVGNLYISLFEVLFKNPLFLQDYYLPIEELDSGGAEGSMAKLTRVRWIKHWALVGQKFARLRQLDSYLDGSSGALELSLYQKVEKGTFTIRDVPTEFQIKHTSRFTTCQTGNIFVSMDDCNLLAVVDQHSDGEDYFLTLTVCDARTGKVLHVIRTGLIYSFFQIDLANFAIRRVGKTGWRRNFCLTKDRISMLYCDTTSKSSRIKIWSHAFTSSDTEVDILIKEPLVDELFAETAETQKNSLNPKSAIFHSENKIVICAQNPFRTETVLNVYDGDGGELVLSIDWPEEELRLVGFKENRALLVNSTTNAVVFFSTDSGEPIISFPFSEMNEGTQSYGPWAGMFDSSPGVNEFYLVRSDNSKFQLYSYLSDQEMAKPTLLFSGPINDTYKLTSECLSTAKLKNGVIFFNRKIYLPQESRMDGWTVDGYHEVAALNLRAQSCTTIITMGTDNHLADATKYNELSHTHFDTKLKFSDLFRSTVVETFDPCKRPLFFINPTSFGILMELGNVIKIFDFGHDDKSVVATEIIALEEQKQKEDDFHAQQKIQEDEKEKRKERKKERLEKQKKDAEDRFVEKDVLVRGRVGEWRVTYGFIRAKGLAKKLGRIFFHRSNVPGHENRRYFRPGMELQYYLVHGRVKGTYEAVQVKVV
jgi:hypothetical protein